MANPRVQQGTLNRLRGNVVFADHPELNITASFLGREGITLTRQGPATTFIDTMTGLVTSPEPYQHMILRAALLKTQSLAALFEAQMVDDSQIGDFIFTTDAVQQPKYQVLNSAIQSVEPLNAAGTDAGYIVLLEGYYLVNNSLWDI